MGGGGGVLGAAGGSGSGGGCATAARRLDLARVADGMRGGGAARDCTFEITGMPPPALCWPLGIARDKRITSVSKTLFNRNINTLDALVRTTIIEPCFSSTNRRTHIYAQGALKKTKRIFLGHFFQQCARFRADTCARLHYDSLNKEFKIRTSFVSTTRMKREFVHLLLVKLYANIINYVL